MTRQTNSSFISIPPCTARSFARNMRLKVGLSALLATGSSSGVLASLGSFHEELTLHPLPDGSLSVSFDFSTYFDASAGRESRSTSDSIILSRDSD